MVSGGHDGSDYLDNIEVYKDGVWKTVSGRLPTGIAGPRATTISGNRVLTFGKTIYQNVFLLTMKLFRRI